MGPSDFPHGIRIQIEVDNIDEALTKSVESETSWFRGKMEFDDLILPDLVDPVGNGIGLIQNK